MEPWMDQFLLLIKEANLLAEKVSGANKAISTAYDALRSGLNEQNEHFLQQLDPFVENMLKNTASCFDVADNILKGMIQIYNREAVHIGIGTVTHLERGVIRTLVSRNYNIRAFYVTDEQVVLLQNFSKYLDNQYLELKEAANSFKNGFNNYESGQGFTRDQILYIQCFISNLMKFLEQTEEPVKVLVKTIGKEVEWLKDELGRNYGARYR